jgi:hypothetical protein
MVVERCAATDYSYLFPTEATWSAGDRTVACLQTKKATPAGGQPPTREPAGEPTPTVRP